MSEGNCNDVSICTSVILWYHVTSGLPSFRIIYELQVFLTGSRFDKC